MVVKLVGILVKRIIGRTVNGDFGGSGNARGDIGSGADRRGLLVMGLAAHRARFRNGLDRHLEIL